MKDIDDEPCTGGIMGDRDKDDEPRTGGIMGDRDIDDEPCTGGGMRDWDTATVGRRLMTLHGQTDL